MNVLATKLMSLGNRLATSLPRPARRFLLDRLGLASVSDHLAKSNIAAVSFEGYDFYYNPLLHNEVIVNGRVSFEDEVVRKVIEFLKQGDTFFDVGANIGVFSINAVQIVGFEGLVIAFEPEPNNLFCLERTVAAAGPNLKLMPVAVGAVEGRQSFDRRGGAFSGRLVAGGLDSVGKSYEVDVVTIDDLIARGERPPNVIKIDVEGAESQVLDGAKETLKRHRPVVICEMHMADGQDPTGAYQTLKDAGYSIEGLSTGKTIEAIVGGHVLARPPG